MHVHVFAVTQAGADAGWVVDLLLVLFAGIVLLGLLIWFMVTLSRIERNTRRHR